MKGKRYRGSFCCLCLECVAFFMLWAHFWLWVETEAAQGCQCPYKLACSCNTLHFYSPWGLLDTRPPGSTGISCLWAPWRPVNGQQQTVDVWWRVLPVFTHTPLSIRFFKRLLFFSFTAKLRGRYGDSLYTSCFHTCTLYPTISSPLQNGTFFTVNEPTL